MPFINSELRILPLRPCTWLLHSSLSHRTSSLPLVNFGQRSLVSSSVCRNGSEGVLFRKACEHRGLALSRCGEGIRVRDKKAPCCGCCKEEFADGAPEPQGGGRRSWSLGV